jgi:hypothetical protein
MEILEIRSSHDLTASSTQARRVGAHSYQVNCRHFNSVRRYWQNDKAPRADSTGFMTLNFEQIWITDAEVKQVTEAIRATRSPLTLE